jgi:HSP20 family protein
MTTQNQQLTRRDTLEGLSPFGATFGRWFDEMWGHRTDDGERLLAPVLDVWEDEHALVVSAELPGLGKDDVKVQVENGVLTISGEKKVEQRSEDRSYHRLERRYGTFYRAITLPKGVAADGAEADFENGVLRVRLPKREDVKPRTVKVK